MENEKKELEMRLAEFEKKLAELEGRVQGQPKDIPDEGMAVCTRPIKVTL